MAKKTSTKGGAGKRRTTKKTTASRKTKKTTRSTSAAKSPAGSKSRKKKTTKSAADAATTRPPAGASADKPAKPAKRSGSKSAPAASAAKVAKGASAAKPAKVAKAISAAKATSAAKAATLASEEDDGRTPEKGPLSDNQLRRAKSGLTRSDKNRYRQLLFEKRQEILGDVASLQVDAKNNGGDISHMPVHMADIGSDNYEQEFTLGLVESERKLLREIDEALVRIAQGTYGVCVESGKPIGKPRLDAKPWAKYCIDVVRERERRGRS